jgi:hypothetical protein
MCGKEQGVGGGEETVAFAGEKLVAGGGALL